MTTTATDHQCNMERRKVRAEWREHFQREEDKSASRQAFEEWYTTNAFDYEANPIGSRQCGVQWEAWQAAGGYFMNAHEAIA